MKITVVQKVSGTDYTLLKRNSSFQPYILAYYFNPEDTTWGQGHYFQSLYGVEAYLNQYAENGYVNDSDIIGYELVEDIIQPLFR